jgi:hypothetical protein
VLRLLDSIPFFVMILGAFLLAIAPFGQTPHLVEKWRMLFAGTLRRPIDVFDFFLHTAPLLLLAAKTARAFLRGR